MKYKVLIIEKYFYEWEIEAGSHDEAKYLAKKFFTLSSERDEKFIEKKLMAWSSIKKSL